MSADRITTDKNSPIPDPCGPENYQIRVKGYLLHAQWSSTFEGLAVTLDENGTTLLTGPLDQAALHGIFKKVRDLGLQLVSVNPADPGLAQQSESDRGGQK
jgi:hypothetical protein